MAAVTNPFTITYAGQAVGGASDTYLLMGPHVVDKSFTTFRLVFDVIVKGTSYDADANGLQQLSDTLETAFRKRLAHDETLLIDIDGTIFTYTQGTTIFNTQASIAKSGNPETDRGYSRAYTIVVEGELPADDAAGLRDVQVQVDYEPGRVRTVTMQGTYTALSGTDAVAQYQAGFDAEATTYLTAIGPSPVVWEQVSEDFSLDRNRDGSDTPFSHLCNFTRQFAEQQFDQSSGTLDDTDIRDHSVTFSDTSQHPGDSSVGVFRLRRVTGTYDCAADIEQTTDLQALFDNKIKNHIRDTFITNFNPQVYAVEDRRVSYDETAKRISVAITFVYQPTGGSAVLEVQQSVAYRESRVIDYTPTHGRDELAFEANVGWAVVERIWSRTVMVIGAFGPRRRIGLKASARLSGEIPGFFRIGIGKTQVEFMPGDSVRGDGWNVVNNTSQTMPLVLGDPNETQISTTVLTEAVVERLHNKP